MKRSVYCLAILMFCLLGGLFLAKGQMEQAVSEPRKGTCTDTRTCELRVTCNKTVIGGSVLETRNGSPYKVCHDDPAAKHPCVNQPTHLCGWDFFFENKICEWPPSRNAFAGN